MGVSISYRTPKGKEVDITPGARSTLYKILLDGGYLNRDLTMSAVHGLAARMHEQARETYHKRRHDDVMEPFDAEMACSIAKIIVAISDHGWVTLRAEF